MGRSISSGTDDAGWREALLAGGWLAALPPEISEAVLDAVAVRRFAAGEAIYRQGDLPAGLFGIVSGQIQTVGTAEDGQPSLLSVLRAGEWTGFLGQLDGRPYQFTTSATVTSEIAVLSGAAVKAIFGESAARRAMLAAPLFAILRVAYGYLIETNGRPPLRVVAQRLLDLGRCVYLPGSASTPVLEAISQDDIAAATYLTRPTVNRVLRDLEGKGIIRLGYGRVEIKDVPALYECASGSSPGRSSGEIRPDPSPVWRDSNVPPRPPHLAEILVRGGWFPAMPDDVQHRILAVLRLRSFKTGEAIYPTGEAAQGLVVLISGQARIIGEAHDGSQTLMGLVHPGEWTGFLSVLDSGPQPLTLVASKSSTAALLPLDMVRDLFFADPVRYQMLLMPVLYTLRYTYEYLIETNRRSPARLVAQRLFDMARCTHLPEIKPRDFVDNLTQDDLASATGLTRPTVNRVMKELTARGIIAIGYGKITIRDPAALIGLTRV